MALKLISRGNEAPKDSEKEGWGGYLTRNIAKAPMLGYQAVRSGFGAGHVLGAAAEELNAPQAIKTGLSYLLPTPEQARQEFKQLPTTIAQNAVRSFKNPLHSLLGTNINENIEQASQGINADIPDYFTESRPGDYWAEQAIQAAPFLAQSAASAGIKGAAKTAGVLGSALAGSTVGGEVGREIGKRGGLPKTGEAVGGLAGGFGGAIAAHSAINRPYTTIAPKIQEIKTAAIEAEQSAAAAALEAERASLLAEQDIAMKDVLKSHRDTMLELSKEKSKFEASKKDRINKINKEVDLRLKELDDLSKVQRESYSRAKSLEGDVTGSAENIANAMNKADKELTAMTMADKAAIRDILADIDSKIVNGEIPLSEVTNIQKNLNDYRYNRSISTSALKRINAIVQASNEFIKDVGSPEFNDAWQTAESATREIKDLYNIGRKGSRTPAKESFFKTKAEEIKQISKEKFSPETEARFKQAQQESKQTIKRLETEQKKAQQLLGKDTANKISTDASTADKLVDFITKYGEMGRDKLGTVALGYFVKQLGFPSQKLATALIHLGKTGVAELNIAKNAWEHHPAIYKDFANGIKAAVAGDFPKAAALINNGSVKAQKKENKIKKGSLTKISSGAL